MNRFVLPFCCFVFINILFITGPSTIFAEDKIRINGSGTCLEMMKPLIEAYRKDTSNVSFQMEKPLGSSGAIKALLAGAIDIAAVSRRLTPEEITRGAKLRSFGRTPLAIVAEKKVPSKNISTKDLEDIYSGKTLKWPGGETIRIILRPKEDVDTKILKSLSPGMAAAMVQAQHRQGMIIAVTDPESNEAVSRTSGGIGASGLAGVLAGRLQLKIIALNGVVPSRENLADGTYPLGKEVSFVTTGKPSAASAKFLKFIYSQKGRSMAEKIGVEITVNHP